MMRLLNSALFLVLVLCVADALGQEITSGHAKYMGSTSQTTASGNRDPFKPMTIVPKQVDHLGDLARVAREAHVAQPHTHFVWLQGKDGQIEKVVNPNPNATTDSWLVRPHPVVVVETDPVAVVKGGSTN